jgi:hypothetical protein
MVNGRQHTLTWHKATWSQVLPILKINDQFIAWLDAKYGSDKAGHITATWGKINEYVGMTFDYSEKGKVWLLYGVYAIF